MKKKDRKELGRYIRWIADEMGLRDWQFDLVVDKPEREDPEDFYTIATCKPCIGRKMAEIRCDPVVRNIPRKHLRQTICHELVHCHLFTMWDLIRRDLLPQMGQEAYDLFTASCERNMEYGVDAIGDVIAQKMPLIDWPSSQ